MKTVQLKSGLWLVGEFKRLAVAWDQNGMSVLGYILQGDDDRWRIEGRDEEFDSARSAVDELVKSHADKFLP
jgi:hypothetical protein